MSQVNTPCFVEDLRETIAAPPLRGAIRLAARVSTQTLVASTIAPRSRSTSSISLTSRRSAMTDSGQPALKDQGNSELLLALRVAWPGS